MKNPKRAMWAKKSQLKIKFGLSYEDYLAMCEKQGGLCKLCNKPNAMTDKWGKIPSLAVDHNHKTGKVRGLLCFNCNTALGKFKDDLDWLEAARNYLSAG